MNITYDVTFLNAVQGDLFAHLSLNERDQLISLFILVPLYIFATVLGKAISRQLKQKEKYHWTARLLLYSVYLGLASQLLFIIDLILSAVGGVGAVVENDLGANVRVFQVAALLVFFLVR